jgi:hypothetical protein
VELCSCLVEGVTVCEYSIMSVHTTDGQPSVGYICIDIPGVQVHSGIYGGCLQRAWWVVRIQSMTCSFLSLLCEYVLPRARKKRRTTYTEAKCWYGPEIEWMIQCY